MAGGHQHKKNNRKLKDEDISCGAANAIRVSITAIYWKNKMRQDSDSRVCLPCGQPNHRLRRFLSQFSRIKWSPRYHSMTGDVLAETGPRRLRYGDRFVAASFPPSDSEQLISGREEHANTFADTTPPQQGDLRPRLGPNRVLPLEVSWWTTRVMEIRVPGPALCIGNVLPLNPRKKAKLASQCGLGHGRWGEEHRRMRAFFV